MKPSDDMEKKKFDDKLFKITLQSIVAGVVIIAGIVLIFLGFYADPTGEIHPSVLTAFGEASTLGGALLGVDASYKTKMYTLDKEYKLKKDETAAEEDI